MPTTFTAKPTNQPVTYPTTSGNGHHPDIYLPNEEPQGHLPDGPLPPTDRYFTWEEYLEWIDENTHAEWVDGTVVFHSPVTLPHDQVDRWLSSILDYYIEVNELGVACGDPFVMHLPTRPSGRQPDSIFVANENLPRLGNNLLTGPADFAVEIISKSTKKEDYETKFAEYEAGGVREYWILDPLTETQKFYVRDANGRYEERFPNEDGRYYSAAVTGFFINVAWLWAQPRPSRGRVHKELGLP